MNCVVPFVDTLHLDSAVDLVLLTQTIDPTSFPLKGVYENSSDLAFFTLGIDLFCYLGVLLILLYNFIHKKKIIIKNKKIKKN